ncbi:MAG: hypothetical protein DCC55_09980 [Chloroflexi bacterium]|nr:MAG: hypothetical protein DCC55_09980 [Chloroflexota bacterium]
MKRVIGILVVIGLLAGGWWVYTTYQARQAEREVQQAAAAEQAEELEHIIWASGKLEPVVWAGLSTATSGVVSAIHVEEGSWVSQGDLLLVLENGVLQSQVDVAAAAVAEAEAALASLHAGATAEQLAAGEANVAAAEANVALAAGQMLEVQAAIDTAKAQLNRARAEYAELASHPTEAERTAAVAEVAVAQAGMEQAQAAYNLVRGDPAIGARPESMTLRQMTAQWEAAKAAAALATQGPTTQQLSVAANAISIAQAQVAMAESKAPGAEAAVKAALAQVESAKATLEVLHTGATPEELDMATARIQSAQAALATTEAQLRQSQLFAPFSGQVGAVNIRLGELATPGQFLVLLGDARQMHIKTTDLRETDVVHLDVGAPLEVTFDALPDQFFAGRITKIAPVSVTQQGSTNYTVEIEVENLSEQARWGMTAFVNIPVAQDAAPTARR